MTLVQVVPNAPGTPTHTIRVDQELWDKAKNKAQEEGTTITEVVIKALRLYLRD